MTNNILLKNLKDFGMKENHAKILMNLIQMRQASVNDISKKTYK
jgi:sugar-specific transcriptional regulator TrmB